MTQQPDLLTTLKSAFAKLEATPAQRFEPEIISPEEYAERAAERAWNPDARPESTP